MQKTPEQPNFHMPPAEFRKQGKAMIDWIADYYENVGQYPVMSQNKPGDVRAMLPKSAPQNGESFSAMMADVEKIVMPGITHWQSPDFFAYFPSNTSGPSILGELLSSGLGVQGMIWATSPACTELETHVMDWLVDMLGLPAKFLSSSAGGGVIQDTASSSILTAMLAARSKITNLQANEKGNEEGLVVYTSKHTHSSMEKGAVVAGIGRENVRLIDVDENFAMRTDLLRAAIEADLSAGRKPFFVAATVGTTSSNAMDSIDQVGEICQEFGLWFHVDAAMSGTAMLCPEFRHLQNGVELADSYCFNPHKWMFTNFDCNCFYVADRKALIDSMSILPAYLKNAATASGDVIDYRDWHIPLGRRFRALKLWFVIRHYGVEGLQAHIRYHIDLTKMLTKWVDDHPDFIRVAPAPLNLVCFKHAAGDDCTRFILESLNDEGDVYLTQTKLNDEYIIRVCIGQAQTNLENVEKCWRLIQQKGQDWVKVNVSE